MLAVWGQLLFARYWQNLAEPGGEESANGRLKYIKKLGPKKGERNKRERRVVVGAVGILKHLWRYLVDLGSQF